MNESINEEQQVPWNGEACENDNNDDDDNGRPPSNSTADPTSTDPSLHYEAMKVQHWKESPYAVGLVDITWKDGQRQRQRQQEGRCCCCYCCCSCQESEFESYLCCSEYMCGWLGAGRVGNMAILCQTNKRDNNDPTAAAPPPPRLLCVAGPYWPVNVCLTFPVFVGLSCVTAVRAIPDVSLPVQIVWVVITVLLFVSLVSVSCRDPGILRRHAEIPEAATSTTNEPEWRWNDQALTYRPQSAKYDPDCAVVVEHFDHTCPWTGTAIGKKNMMAFRMFLVLALVCLVFDVILLTGIPGTI